MKSLDICEKVCEKAYRGAVKVIRDCISPAGLKASIKGYPQVWARDSMITLLGTSLLDNEEIIDSLRKSLDILRKNQTKIGCIPNNVDVRTLKPDYHASADSGLWFVIGASFFYESTKDEEFLKKFWPSIKKTMNWYAYQDVDNSNLITMAEASDWEDLLAIRGKGLYVNALYSIALKKATELAEKLGHGGYSKRSEKIASAVDENFWYKGEITPNLVSLGKEAFGAALKEGNLPSKKILKDRRYYLPYLTFRNFGEWFDTFGNLLAIISDIASEKRSKQILDLIDSYGLAEPYPIKAIYPPIKPGMKDWRYYYEIWNLNLPNQYHNGGIWPFLGGFYIVSLVKIGEIKKAQRMLKKLAQLNKKGKKQEWEFNEWFHGITGKPMGSAKQAWSAGMYLYAYKVLQNKKLLFI